MRRKKEKKQFSKVLLIQESILIWITTISCIILAFVCITAGYLGSLPWISAMCAFPWTAYGISQACYYGKSKAENTQGGITYFNAMQMIAAGNGTENEDYPII